MEHVGKKGKPNYVFFWFAKLTGYISAKLYFFPKIFYEDRSVQGRHLQGPCIVISNHTDFIDFMFYMLVFPRDMIRFLTAEIQFSRSAILSWLLYATGAIYIDRNPFNTAYIDECLKAFEKGEIVGVFPQGRITPKGHAQYPYKTGIVNLALAADVPIIPVYHEGHYNFFKSSPVIIGKPLYLKDHFDQTNPTKEEKREMAKFLENKTWELRDEMYRRMEKKSK